MKKIRKSPPRRTKAQQERTSWEEAQDFEEAPAGSELTEFTVAIIGRKDNPTVKSLTWAFNRSLVKILHVDNEEMTVEDLLKDVAHVVFFCNDIHQNEDGVYIATELENDVLRVLASMECGICVKTRMPIDLVDRLCSRNKRIVYHPDVVGDHTGSIEEQMDPRMFILGGHPQSTMALQEIYFRFSNYRTASISHLTAVEAAVTESAIAAACGMKIVFFNQLYDVLDEYGGDYHLVSTYLGGDPRIGAWGARIPNFDLSRGIYQPRIIEAVKQLVKFNERFTLLQEVDRMNDTYRNRGKEDNEHNGQAEEEQQADSDLSTE